MGGSDTVIKRAQGYLALLSNNQIHFGDTGSGTVYKKKRSSCWWRRQCHVAHNSQLIVAGEHEKEVF
ncbi:MAG: hypothetical protein GY761_06365 [Hyphomicrobiales bacterium]|nr:hypothetical protein [Hyphomicrobiales bacterium]